MRHTSFTCDCHSLIELLNIPIIPNGPTDTQYPLMDIFLLKKTQFTAMQTKCFAKKYTTSE